ncbi:hypothetical protein [Paenibacillus sp. FSL H8-0537]|uniref:hypothetical protein n=1 Tax=Paenibacillus sp. FSL H8-0537 TaxID=2921399 RepID=UPI0031011735
MREMVRREREVKLEVLASIARSQLALARILNSVADVAELAPQTAKRIGENVRLLTNMQEQLAESVTGWPVRSYRVRTGKPPEPWLRNELRGKQVRWHPQVNRRNWN